MTRSWAHDGLVIAVDADADEIAWLEELLAPAFAPTAASPRVRVVCEAPAKPPPAVPPTATPVTFAFDSGPIRWPASCTPEGLRLHDPSGRAAVTVSARGCEVHVHRFQREAAPRFLVLRVMRELAHNHSIATGGLVLHAAAVCVDGRAVAIAGPKGRGKTTLALRLLARPGVSYLSNDRVLVRSAAAPRAIAVPTVIALRAGTRALLPDLADRLSACGDFREHAAERQRRGPSRPAMAGDTWHLSPRQLCEALGCSMEAEAPLAAVLFPTPHRTPDVRLRRLDVQEAAAALTEAVLCRESGHYTSEVFLAPPRHRADPARIEAACHALGAAVACFECSLPVVPSSDDMAVLATCLEATP